MDSSSSQQSSSTSKGRKRNHSTKLFRKNLFNFSTDKEPIGGEFKLPPRVTSTKLTPTSPTTETNPSATTTVNNSTTNTEITNVSTKKVDETIDSKQQNPFLYPADASLQKQFGSSLLSSFITTATSDSDDEEASFISTSHFGLYHETTGAIKMTVSVLKALISTSVNNTNASDASQVIFSTQILPTLLRLCEVIFSLFKTLPSNIPASYPTFLECLNNAMNMTISFCSNCTKPNKPFPWEEYSRLVQILSDCLEWITNQMQKMQQNNLQQWQWMQQQQQQQQQTHTVYLESAMKRLERKNLELITRVRQTNYQLEREMKEWKDEILLSHQWNHFTLLNEVLLQISPPQQQLQQTTKDYSQLMQHYLHSSPLLKSKLKPLFLEASAKQEEQLDGYSRCLFVGSSPNSFATIKEAIAAAKIGDSILISEGIYNESLIIDKPIRLIGLSSPDRVVICCSENCETIFVSCPSQEVLLSHLTICQTATHSLNQSFDSLLSIKQNEESLLEEPVIVYAAIRITGKETNCSIENCIINGGLGSGIHLEHCNQIQIRTNRISQCKGNGITMLIEEEEEQQQQASNSSVMNISIEDNDILQHQSNGICIISASHTAEVNIANNRLRENQQNGIYVLLNNSNNIQQLMIQKNSICKNQKHGIHILQKLQHHNLMEEMEPIVIITNQMMENMRCGICVEQGAFCHIENNELSKNRQQNCIVDELSKEAGTVEFGNIEESNALLLEEI